MLCVTRAECFAVQSAPGCRDRASGRRLSFAYGRGRIRTVRSLRGVLAASVCLLAVPIALLCQLIVGGGAEIVLHLVLGVGFLLTAFAVFDFGPTRWLPWVGCLSIGALGSRFCCKASVSCCTTIGSRTWRFKSSGKRSKHGQVTFSWCGVALRCC